MSREQCVCGSTAIPEVTMKWSCGQVRGQRSFWNKNRAMILKDRRPEGG